MIGPDHGPGRGFGLGVFDAIGHAVNGVVMSAAAVLIFKLLIALGIVLVRFLLVATKAAEIYVADHRPAAAPEPTAPVAPTTPVRPARAPRAPRTPPPTA